MIYLYLADGFEETEAVAVYDILKRADFDVKTVAVASADSIVSSNKKLRIIADLCEDEADVSEAEMIVLPGGMPGVENLYKSDYVKAAVLEMYSSQKYIAAICAAPIILGRMNLTKNKTIAVYPGFESEFQDTYMTDENVAIDGKIITANAVGGAFDFGLKIVEVLKGKEQAENLKRQMLYKNNG